MAKQHHIRWKPSDNEELTRIVRNFNSKITRTLKKNPELKNALPDKVSVKELKELINTRADLKRELNSLKRFSKRGSESIVTYGDYNIKVTKWQKAEMNRRVAIINRRREDRRKRIEALEMTQGGKSLGYTKGQFGMGKIELLELNPMKAFTPGMNQRDVKKKWTNILKQSQSSYITKKDYLLRENYIQSLEQNFNPADIKDVIYKINNMDIGEFVSKFMGEGGNFETSYPPNEEQYRAYLTGLKSTWLPSK